MARLDLNIEGNVAVVTMDEADNKLNLEMVRSLLDLLDRVEKETGAFTVVVKSGHSHIWTNGFDIDWILANLEKGDKATVKEFLVLDLALRKRLLTYPLITIAALNGHCFGGGAVLSLCFDFRFMRLDRGFFCIPVIDRGYPILPGTRSLLNSKLPGHIVNELILTGKRMTGAECAAGHIVTAAYNNEELMDKVMEYSKGLNKGRGIVGEMKRVMHAHTIKLLEEDAVTIQEGQILV